AAELRELGLADVEHTDRGIVYATLPARGADSAPVIAWFAHMDTSPETTGAGGNPQVIRGYPGGDITLPNDPSRVLRESENPDLAKLKGKTIITTDGTTLLGADNKAGVAVIMETVATLLKDADVRHGPIRICFT